jgi:membrane protease YdiL (CAAX protease family)
MITSLWLFILLVVIALWTVNDTRQYRRFVTATDSMARRAFYWTWTVQSFVVLTVASVITLAALGRFDALGALPPEFAALRVGAPPEAANASQAAGLRVGMFVGFSIGALITILVWRQRVKALRTPIVADIEPLIPRNRAEQLAALPLCLNAGYAEELFFRLALPLLLTTITGSAGVGIGVAIVIFGLIHWYQGWRGILATTFVGCLLTVVYLKSGSLLRVMVLHAAIDVVGLLVRPMLVGHFTRTRPAVSSV